jgi:transcriptional regulator with XRE-family HTH domain
MKSRGPQSLDKVVGRNVRVHRLAKGMSQTDLANELGITFQQIQKYEKGTNRVGSGRLFEISVILGVSVLTLFEGGKATLAKGDDSSPFNLLADPLSLRLASSLIVAIVICRKCDPISLSARTSSSAYDKYKTTSSRWRGLKVLLSFSP